MTLKDKIILYVYNKSDTAENEYNEHINYYRYHKADEVDHLETIIRKVRRDTIKEITSDLLGLLKLSNYTK